MNPAVLSGTFKLFGRDKVSTKYKDMTWAISLQFFLPVTRSLAENVLMYLCDVLFAGCSFTWPSSFATGSYILRFRRRNESLAELHIVAAQRSMTVAQTTGVLLITMDAAVRKQAVVEIA